MRKYGIILTLVLFFTGGTLCHAFVIDEGDKSMLKLSPDETFNYELLRVLATSRAYGADVAEVLIVAEKVTPGDFESWYNAFIKLADHINNNLPDATHPVSLRNALFRAANYYRTADFFLHGNPADPRINDTWAKQRECFDKAISLLDIPGQRVEIKTSGFTVPAIVYKPDNTNKPRPTLLLCNGYDGSQEEMLHVIGFTALERGFNVVTFEGPGQPTVVREQHLGFIAEWEKVVTPVMDYCNSLDFVDDNKIVLMGYSFGGYLAPRAAAFEHRLAAVACVDGLFDIYDAFLQSFPPALRQIHKDGNSTLFDKIVWEAMKDEDNIKLRWGTEQGCCWAFCTDSPYEFLERTRSMTMKNIARNIQCPVLVCDAESDHFFSGQPQILANAIGTKATYMKFTSADSAQEHFHTGATDFATAKIMDWFEDIFK
jgi:cephalosporin-C deacetylase-like acetyl esterase